MGAARLSALCVLEGVHRGANHYGMADVQLLSAGTHETRKLVDIRTLNRYLNGHMVISADGRVSLAAMHLYYLHQ